MSSGPDPRSWKFLLRRTSLPATCPCVTQQTLLCNTATSWSHLLLDQPRNPGTCPTCPGAVLAQVTSDLRASNPVAPSRPSNCVILKDLPLERGLSLEPFRPPTGSADALLACLLLHLVLNIVSKLLRQSLFLFTVALRMDPTFPRSYAV